MHHQRWWDMQETHERNNRLQNTCMIYMNMDCMYTTNVLRKCSKCFSQNIQLRLSNEWMAKIPEKIQSISRHYMKFLYARKFIYILWRKLLIMSTVFPEHFFSPLFFQISKVSLAQLHLNISIGIPVQPMRQIRRYNEFLRAFVYCVLFVRIMNSSSSSSSKCAFCSKMDRQVECIRFMHELHYVRYQLDGRYIGI